MAWKPVAPVFASVPSQYHEAKEDLKAAVRGRALGAMVAAVPEEATPLELKGGGTRSRRRVREKEEAGEEAEAMDEEAERVRRLEDKAARYESLSARNDAVDHERKALLALESAGTDSTLSAVARLERVAAVKLELPPTPLDAARDRKRRTQMALLSGAALDSAVVCELLK